MGVGVTKVNDAVTESITSICKAPQNLFNLFVLFIWFVYCHVEQEVGAARNEALKVKMNHIFT